MHVLFDDFDRIDDTIIGKNESTYDFINRSSYEHFQNIRDRVRTMMNIIPVGNKVELISGLKTNWESSYFELFLANLFAKLDFTIEIHPELSNTNKRPDFKLSNSDSIIFAEARYASDKSIEDHKIENIKNDIKYGININIKSKNFFIAIQELVILERRSSSLRELYSKIRVYINENIGKEIFHLNEDTTERRDKWFFYENETFKIVLSLIPRNPDFPLTRKSRVIGMESGPFQLIDSKSYILRALNKKATRYGNLDKPFVLCIQAGSEWGIHISELYDIFYGDGVFNSDTEKSYRRNNGFFGYDDKPKMTRVSGVIIVQMHYSKIDNCHIDYFANPYAKYPVQFSKLMDFHDRGSYNTQINRNTFNVL